MQRAEEWMRVVRTQMLEPMGGRPRVLHTHCRLAYGAVLSTAGRWNEAEAEMLEAIGPHGSQSLGHRVEATARLAELRLHRGSVDEAAELLRAHEDALASCAPMAQVHLRRGEPDQAVAVAQRGLRELVGDVSRAAPLWAIVVEAEIARGDFALAATAADRLAALAVEAELPILHAERELAAGRVLAARGEHAAAVDAFGRAQIHFAEAARPLPAGVTHLETAVSLAELADNAGAVAEARVALATFERLGAAASADRARALLRRLGASTASRPGTPTERVQGLTTRETEVLALLRQGLTNGEIAARLFISAKTAEHHVSRILTKLGVRTRAEAAAVASASRIGGTP